MPDMESLKLEGTMARKIKCTLSASGLEEMRNQILAYSNDLQRKCQILVSKLSNLGLDVVRQTMESIPSEEKGSYHTEVINASNGDIIGAAIRLSGDKVLFLEFSAGITYGTKDYPLPSGNGYGMGTYPGKGHWDSPYGWWWIDENGEKHHSYGNRAYMPMYHAEEAIVIQVREVAKEVFGG